MDRECTGTNAPNPDLPATGGSRGPRFNLRSLLVGTMVICILLAVLVPSLRQVRRAAQQMQCQNNLKQIALALHN